MLNCEDKKKENKMSVVSGGGIDSTVINISQSFSLSYMVGM